MLLSASPSSRFLRTFISEMSIALTGMSVTSTGQTLLSKPIGGRLLRPCREVHKSNYVPAIRL